MLLQTSSLYINDIADQQSLYQCYCRLIVFISIELQTKSLYTNTIEDQ